MRSKRSIIVRLTPLYLIAGFLVIWPMVFLIVSSFSTQKIPGVGTFGFTLSNYDQLINSPTFNKALVNTLTYSISKTILSLVVGTALAWLVARTNIPWKGFIMVATVMPIVVPYTLKAMGWTFLFGPRAGLVNAFFKDYLGWTEPFFNVFTMAGMVLSGAFVTFTLDFLIIYPAVRQMNPELEDASRIAGSGPYTGLLRVTLPMIAPSILIAGILGFVKGVEVLTPALFIGLPGGINVLSSEIYQAIQRTEPANYGYGSSLAVVLLTASVILIALYRRATALQSKYVTITGKAPRPKLIDLGKARYVIMTALIFFYSIGIFVPIILIVIESLLPFSMPYSMEVFSKFSVKNFDYVLNNTRLISTIYNTVTMVLAGAIITLSIALLLGYVAIRTKLPLRGGLHGLAIAPLAMPGIVIGVALIWTFVRTPIYASVYILVIAITIKSLPYGLALSSNTLYQVGSELEESSRICGASWASTFRKIMMPLLRASITFGLIYIMIRNVGELEVVLLLRGSENEVLSTWLWAEWQNGSFRIASALAVITLFVNVLLFTIPKFIERGGRRVTEVTAL